MFNAFYFITPLWLVGVLAVFLGLFFSPKRHIKTPKVIQSITLYYPLLNALNKTQTAKKSNHHSALISLIVICIFISLAQPAIKTPLENKQQKTQAVDLILVVNTSVSMVLRDYMDEDNHGELIQLDRMTKTKQLLKQLVTRFKGKRIGLVVLGRPASVWLPLTGDKCQVQHAIARLQTTLGGRTNDIGATLQLVLKHFKQPSTSQKTVLLINDGYLQIGSVSPLQGIQQLVEKGFILHSLAIGSPQRPNYSLGIGHLIYAPVDLKLMGSLAKAGQGKMIHAWNNETVNELLTLLDKPILTPTLSKTRFTISALYFYPLGLAMLLMLLLVFPFKSLFIKKPA